MDLVHGPWQLGQHERFWIHPYGLTNAKLSLGLI